MGGSTAQRWEALDLLRGLSIIGMLLNLNPGAWDHQYGWLEHAKWEGGHLIDVVAPIFLFCVGAVLPLAIARRLDRGASRAAVAGHVLWRTFALVAIGFLLNLYPDFDWAHVRIPGVLQRIGLTYGLVGLLLLATSRREGERTTFPLGLLVAAAVLVPVAYFALLYFVPVPGWGAPRFDPVGSWPSVVDRAVIGRDHMFRFWPVNGRVEFDPEGIVSTWPAMGEVLCGAIVGLIQARGGLRRPLLTVLPAGAALMALAVTVSAVCPIIKNIWTPTFTLFTVGFALALLAVLAGLHDRRWFEPIAVPSRVFGSNALLAYISELRPDSALGPRLDHGRRLGPDLDPRLGPDLLPDRPARGRRLAAVRPDGPSAAVPGEPDLLASALASETLVFRARGERRPLRFQTPHAKLRAQRQGDARL